MGYFYLWVSWYRQRDYFLMLNSIPIFLALSEQDPLFLQKKPFRASCTLPPSVGSHL
jgi:hypothetical protein